MSRLVSLTSRFDRALVFASEAHRRQCRKDSPIPYISHLLAVCAIVLEYGGSEEQAIAALLHDAPEDQGGAAMLDRIRAEFSPAIADLVVACGEPLALAGMPWRQRKEAFLRHLDTAPPQAVLVIAADKIHNLASILDERERYGEAVFARFGGKKEGTLWYYARLEEILGPRVPVVLARRFCSLVRELHGPGAA